MRILLAAITFALLGIGTWSGMVATGDNPPPRCPPVCERAN